MIKFKKVISMSLALIMVCAMSTSVFAAEPVNNSTHNNSSIIMRSGSPTITENYVRLRAKPTIHSTALRQLQKGDYVTIQYGDWVEADGYTWVPVQSSKDGCFGWVASIYLSDY